MAAVLKESCVPVLKELKDSNFGSSKMEGLMVLRDRGEPGQPGCIMGRGENVRLYRIVGITFLLEEVEESRSESGLQDSGHCDSNGFGGGNSFSLGENGGLQSGGGVFSARA